MVLACFETSFSAILTALVWFVLPLYGALVGLCTSLLAKTPAAASFKQWAGEVRQGRATFHTQLFIYLGAGGLMLFFRGIECSFLQGQLYLNPATIKLLYLVLGSLGVGLAAALPLMLPRLPQMGPLGCSHWSLAPLLIVLWNLLPLVTQLSTALLVLELIGVSLIWALTSTATMTNPSLGGGSTAPLGLVYALIIFIWASGLSALGLLLGVGLTSLEGSSINAVAPSNLGGSNQGYFGISDGLLTLVLLFKFLMGGGQFLLLAWYKFLPTDGLVFYLFFYYPAHLLIGTTMFAGFFIPAIGFSFSTFATILAIATVSLLPHLGAQTSPALTLAGSSFIGLSLVILALFNVT